MRTKDENKKAAITKAIIRLINEIGFVDISMSKIAKATGISASTLYVYYESKEDMFRKIYLDVNDLGVRPGYLPGRNGGADSQKNMQKSSQLYAGAHG